MTILASPSFMPGMGTRGGTALSMAYMARDMVVNRARRVSLCVDMGTPFLLTSVGDHVRRFRLGGVSEPDDQPVWQACDGQCGIADEALADTELVGTVCGTYSDLAGADFYFVGAAVFVPDVKNAAFRYFV